MIINLIVAAALILGSAYLLLWVFGPGLRRNIERPKYLFQDKLAEHQQRMSNQNGQENCQENYPE